MAVSVRPVRRVGTSLAQARRWSAQAFKPSSRRPLVTIVMGLDQHRAQITADWVDTSTGEVARARVGPADRAGFGNFLSASVAKSSRWRWRRRRAGGSWSRSCAGWEPECTWRSRRRRPLAREQEARQERSRRRPPSARAVDGGAAARVVDSARSHSRSQGAGRVAAHALRAARRVAAADPGGALPPRLPAAAQPDDGRGAALACRPAAAGVCA
jgi:hypothetical protein